MRTIVSNGIEIYELSKGSVIPEYLGNRRQQKLKAKSKITTSTLEIIHDLTMPDVCTNISISPDQKYLFVLGAYSPRVRCYELEQLSMKFERNVDELPTKIAHIDEDYSKFVVLEGEKTLSFHAAGGIHKKVRCDNVVKDLIYSSYKNQLFIPDSKGKITILDIEKGKFTNGIIDSKFSTSINCAAYNGLPDVFFTGHKDGMINGFDCRTAERCYAIDVRKAPISEYMKKSYVAEVCKIAFKDPLRIGVGTDKGMFHLYDIRNSSLPFSSRDLDYEFPIRNILFHEEKVIASVKSVFKIFEPLEGADGKMIACFDTNADINDFIQFPKTGLFFAASNQPQINTYFIPKIGDAPWWCQQLSNLIVDVEIESQSMYDTHTFVTREEVDELRLDGLIGTNKLRAYMHGFYISSDEYKRARNAQKAAMEREKILLRNAENRDCSYEKREEIDEIPDPAINASLKSLSVDNRFADLFSCERFILNPNCRVYDQVNIDMKHLVKKRNKKLMLQKQAKKSKQMIENVSEEDIEDNMERDSD